METVGFSEVNDVLYGELKQCARRLLKGNHQAFFTTELVHEAMAKIIKSDPCINDKRHLVLMAAKTMRWIVVEEIRAKVAKKREGGNRLTHWYDERIGNWAELENIIHIDRVLNQLQSVSERSVNIIELYYFSGYSQKEIADILSLSIPTIQRDLKFSRDFLMASIRSIENENSAISY
ncbi:antiterminator Q family protein [Pleionea sp. CnH1-48]|uniref:antiterminator Q family protein n=1 Tax=Pleionea sp. CnH1-48 TaxID=2954494 RepID=UPI00209813DB|nr:antiterminator Q family protein [Pleionea sp. CnH1-48]MCO7227150.1 sigma-70 family RNA polymerase sigma factor [Pleionea sp. CnH1-48]